MNNAGHERERVSPGRKMETPSGILVIGCGNTLRGDDAAGFEVARMVGDWGLPGLRALPVCQLTPELAQDLATAAEVVFIDASCVARTLQFTPIDTQKKNITSSQIMAHSMSPASLLSFTNQVYGRSPRAWLVGIPAYSFDEPDVISASTRQSMEAVYAWIRNQIQAQSEEEPHA